MTKTKLIELLNSYGLSKRDAAHAWANIAQDAINELLTTGEAILPGLGALRVAKRSAQPERQWKNPKTGETRTIEAKPEYKTVSFRPHKELRGTLNP